jgi:DNA polymerase IIIc chi subunit
LQLASGSGLFIVLLMSGLPTGDFHSIYNAPMLGAHNAGALGKMNITRIALWFALSFSPAVAEIEYLFSPEFAVGACGPNQRFVIRESDKKKIDQKFWLLRNEQDFVSLLEWMRTEKKEEPIQVKMMAQELYNEADRVLIQKISDALKKKTEPNQPQTPNRTVTECAPNHTFRASAIRV